MKKQTELNKYQDYIMENGIAHLIYNVNDIHDIIHPLSVKGYEMLTEDFIVFIEKYRAIIPPKVPVVLEISGMTLSGEEKELIDNTIWSHFCLNMTQSDMEARTCIKRMLSFIIYTVLTAPLLFAVENVTDEAISNLAYIPFWFFGERLLCYLIIDCMPLWKEKKWYRQLASMNIIFTDNATYDSMNLSVNKIQTRTSEYLDETDEQLKNNLMVLQYLKDKGIMELGCNAESLDDLILFPQRNGREYITDELQASLLQAEPFLSKDSRITFEVQGKAFNPEEQDRIRNGIKNYYGFRIAEEESGNNDNKQRIIMFAIMVLISAFIVSFWGARSNIAVLEYTIIVLWFFGDYLMEFILINKFGYRKKKKILEKCRDMEVSFKATSEQ